MKTNSFLHFALASLLCSTLCEKSSTVSGKRFVVLGTLTIDEGDAYIFKRIAIGEFGGSNSRWYLYQQRERAREIYEYLTGIKL